MATLSQNVLILTELTAGRNVSWTKQTSTDDPPTTSKHGVSLATEQALGVPKTLVAVQLRELIHRRQAKVTITFDASATLTVTANGTAINAAPSGSWADQDAALVGLKAAIGADATVGQAASTPVVDSQLLDSADAVTVGTAAGGNAATTLQIYGESATAYSIAVSTTAGAIACEADAESATLRVYGVAAGSAASPNPPGSAVWFFVDDSEETLASRGFVEEFHTGSLGRLYAALSSVAGHGSDGGTVTYQTQAFIGPAIRET